jgi:hypothetical protein
MVRTSAWFLNFDADEELASPLGYTPRRDVAARFAALTEAARALLGPNDVALPVERLAAGLIGRAFCPTPRAQRELAKAGAVALPAPPLEVLRAVNHRAFSARLGQTLPGARYIHTLEELADTVAATSPTGRWLLKRPFGFAGRGRRSIERWPVAEKDPARAWIEASLRSPDGLQVEPLVARAGDFGLHGHIARSGVVSLGEPTRQDCDASGAWKGSARAAPGDLDFEEMRALVSETERAAAALKVAGYFGPFGVDAFRWVDEAGRTRFNPRCEINARYSMGWAVGMGERRPDLEETPDG